MLHRLKNESGQRLKRRIGRGGKRGSYSGRGHKGQKSRAGRKLRPAQRDLILRLPKLRGFANKPTTPKPILVNVGQLNRFEGTIDRALLQKERIIGKRHRGEIKVLGNGTLTKKLILKGFKVSASARVKIEGAGGKIE